MKELLRHFFGGFIRLHILYHASKESIFGVGIMEELTRHGYKLSPGTLYPILHQLEKQGYLTSNEHVISGKQRKYYKITQEGLNLLENARIRLKELVAEVIDDID